MELNAAGFVSTDLMHTGLIYASAGAKTSNVAWRVHSHFANIDPLYCFRCSRFALVRPVTLPFQFYNITKLAPVIDFHCSLSDIAHGDGDLHRRECGTGDRHDSHGLATS